MVLGVTVADAADGSEVPYVFVAVTVNVHAVPAVSPVTVMEPAPGMFPTPVSPSGLDVAWYCEMEDPPVDVDASNVTVAVANPASVTGPVVATTLDGGLGSSIMVISPEGADATEVPTAFVAVTVNVYLTPTVSPLTGMAPESDCVRVPVIPPGLDVAVYLVIAAPPFDVGAVNATVAVVVPVTVAAPITGAPGAPITATDFQLE